MGIGEDKKEKKKKKSMQSGFFSLKLYTFLSFPILLDFKSDDFSFVLDKTHILLLNKSTPFLVHQCFDFLFFVNNLNTSGWLAYS